MTSTLITNILTGLFEAIIVFMFISSSYKKENKKRSKFISLLAILLITIFINVSNHLATSSIMNVFFMCMSIFVPSLIYGKNIKINAMITIISAVIFMLSEILVFFLITSFLGISAQEATFNESYRILGIILSKMLAFIMFKVICIRQNPQAISNIKTSYWILFFLIFLTSSLTICLLFVFRYSVSLPEIYNTLSVICSFGLLYTTFFTLYLYEHTANEAEMVAKQDFLNRQINEQSKHLNDILASQVQIKKMRHDLSNHNISLQTYFSNKDWEGGLDYIKKMSPDVIFNGDIIDTGNAALDAIINTKRNIAISNKIKFNVRMQIPENLFVDAVDICVIFGNALDNCIEACNRIKGDKKEISLSVVYEDRALVCKIVNTFQNDGVKIYRTSKADKDNHGFGLKNIEDAISKYKNIFRFRQTDNEFILNFIIFEE